jgi:hypothetical protein
MKKLLRRPGMLSLTLMLKGPLALMVFYFQFYQHFWDLVKDNLMAMIGIEGIIPL